MELYRVAADGGIADAMNSLGLLLEDGRGAYVQSSAERVVISLFLIVINALTATVSALFYQNDVQDAVVNNLMLKGLRGGTWRPP